MAELTLAGHRTAPLPRHRPPWHVRLAPYTFVAPTMIAMAAVVAYPIVVVVVESFFDVNPTDHDGWNFVGLHNYGKAWGDHEVRAVLAHSAVWTFGSVALQFVLAMVGALLLRDVIRSSVLKAIFVLPWATPAVVGALAWKLLYHPQYGLINDILGMLGLGSLQRSWLSDPHTALWSVVVANVWRGFPFIMVMLLAGMAAIPDDLYESAQVDGASLWQRHRHVTLPMLRPVILMTTLMSLIWTFNNFSSIYVLTRGGPAGATDILTTFVYKNAFSGFDFGYSSALSVVLFVIVATASTFYIRVFGREARL